VIILTEIRQAGLAANASRWVENVPKIKLSEIINYLTEVLMINYLSPDFSDLPGRRTLPRNYKRGASVFEHLDMSVVREGQSTGGKVGYDIPIIYADMSKTNGLTDS